MKSIFILTRCCILVLFISGCSATVEPFVYEQSNELKPGPGVLTGEQGTYTIYGNTRAKGKQQQSEDEDLPEAAEAIPSGP